MKTAIRSTLTLFALAALPVLQAAEKPYGIEAGQIDYSSQTSGSMMGIKTEGHGSSTLFFKDWGNVQLTKGSETVSTAMTGEQTSQTLQRVEGDTISSVDFDNKTIITLSRKEAEEMSGGLMNITSSGEAFIKANGGQKTGSDTVLGVSCDNWRWSLGTVCLYKGVLLKGDLSLMGIQTRITATRIDLKSAPADNAFALPDYPRQTLQQMMASEMQDGAEGPMPSAEEMQQMMQQMQEMMKQMAPPTQ